jgi:hypothetical protein
VSGQVYASDFQYYYEFKDSADTVISKYKKLQQQCSVNYTDACRDLEVHARNILILKISAYQEFANGVINNFKATFPNTDMADVTERLNKHSGDIANAKYLITIASVGELTELETLINNILIENTATLDLLSAGFHYYKVRTMYDALNLQHERLSKELKAAKDIGLDTSVASKQFERSEKSLDNANKNIKKVTSMLNSTPGDIIPAEVPVLLEVSYKDLMSANASLLQTSQILLRFSERSYWEIE